MKLKRAILSLAVVFSWCVGMEASASTQSGIVVTPDSLTNILVAADDTSCKTIMISNSGDTPLDFSICPQPPSEDDGLILHYTFDDDSGTTVVDQTGNGNDGTIYNEHSYVGGVDGKGLRIVGNSDLTGSSGGYVSLPAFDISALASNGITLSAWVKEEQSWGENYFNIGQLAIAHWGSDISYQVGSEFIRFPYREADRNQFTHYVLSYKDGIARGYRNGALLFDQPQPFSAPSQHNHKTALGRHWLHNGASTAARLVGAFDEVQLYSRQLSGDEVAALYQEHDDGLIAHYPFNGNANDESGNGHDGTVNDATLTSDRFGNADSAYLFDGSDDYIEVPDSTDLRLNDTSFSVSTWFYETARNSSYADGLLFKRGRGSNNGWYYSISGNSSVVGVGKMTYQVSAGIDPLANSDAQVPLNSWIHSVMTYDQASKTVRIYINGILDSTHPNIPSPNALTTESLFIGLDSALATYAFHGKIDDVRIYNRALSAEEITELYYESDGDGLIALFPFNGNADDESGNEHDSAVNGATLTTDRFGNPDSAYHFDGVDDFIEITPSSVPLIEDFTLSAWVYKREWKNQSVYSNMDRQYVFDGHASSSKASRSDIFRPGINMIIDGERSGSRESIHNSIMYSAAPISYMETNIESELTGGWHHLVFQRRGADVYTYLDGTLLSNEFSRENPRDDALDMNHQWFIGTFAGNNPNDSTIGRGYNYSFNGDIDDVRIYNRALSADEISAIYTEAPPAPECVMPKWLSAEPMSGTVPSGACVEVKVGLDAAGMVAGDYVAHDFKVGANGPDGCELMVPVSMWVLPQAPVLNPEPEYTIGESNNVSWGAVAGGDDYHAQVWACTNDAPQGSTGTQGETHFKFCYLQVLDDASSPSGPGGGPPLPPPAP